MTTLRHVHPTPEGQPPPDETGHGMRLVIVADGYVTRPDGTTFGDLGVDAPRAGLATPGAAQGPITASMLGLRAFPLGLAAQRRLSWRAFMAAGLATAHANALLDIYRGTSFTAITLHAKLHTGDPGSAGSSNASAVTTRNSCSFSAASGGSIGLSASPTAYAMTTTETLTHVSLWDASSGGNFVRSVALTASKSVVNLDTFTLSVLTFSYTPLAA